MDSVAKHIDRIAWPRGSTLAAVVLPQRRFCWHCARLCRWHCARLCKILDDAWCGERFVWTEWSGRKHPYDALMFTDTNIRTHALRTSQSPRGLPV
jgi:hypothetical protein